MSDSTRAEGTQPTIWEALDAWAKELLPWQQFVVRTAANQGRLADEDIDKAYRLFLTDKKLVVPAAGESVPEIPPALGRPIETLTDKLVLNRVDAMTGINALPDGSQLTFSDGLTVVYGANGAGKTGFSRLLSNACFSRQKPEILSNIHDAALVTQSAQFHISIGGVSKDPLAFPFGEEASPLRRITCFDSDVARHHLTQAAAFEFKPVGFDVFPEISRVYSVIQERLQAEINTNTEENTFPQQLAGPHGPVYEALQKLGPDTDVQVVRELGIYGKTESDRIDAIGVEITALASKSSKESIAEMRQTKTDADTLSTQITQLEKYFTPDVIAARAQLITEARDAAAALSVLGSDQFKRSFFTAVGGTEWQAFAQTAHALAKKERAGYPTVGGRCLLCEQSLDQPAVDHISALIAYVEGDAKKRSEKAAAAIAAELVRLRALDIGIFADTSRVRTEIKKFQPDLEPKIEAAMQTINAARDTAISDLLQLEAKSSGLNTSGIDTVLTAFSKTITDQIAALAKDDVEAATKKLEDEKRTLRHKQVLSQILPNVEAFIVKAKWIRDAKAALAGISTAHVTNKEKALSDQIIGDGYRARFAEECGKLNCHVPVELKTAGRSGQTVHSLTVKGGHKVDEILSEGEQKAVAIADFLTEVTMNPAAAGIVLDDPVSTLDDRRKQQIADRLVSESKVRQVIVFTHDLVFLTMLVTAAEEKEIQMMGHWVELDGDGHPGQVSLGDLPVTSKVYQSTERAEKALAHANTLAGTERMNALKFGAACLRTTVEETVARRLFKDIIPRWSDRVIVTALDKVNWDNARADEIKKIYEELSGMMEGHSQTDEGHNIPLEPKHLKEKIEQVQEIIKWAKAGRE